MKRLIAALVLLPSVALAQYPGLSSPAGTPAWTHAMRACLLGQGHVPLSVSLPRCHQIEQVQRGEVPPPIPSPSFSGFAGPSNCISSNPYSGCSSYYGPGAYGYTTPLDGSAVLLEDR